MDQSVLIAKVENKPGVLNRVASLFRRRNFNIESLSVGHSETPDVSRMTIVMDASQVDVKKVEANLYKLVNVIDVQDVSNHPNVSRDLVLIKVQATAEQRAEIANLVQLFRAKVVDVAPDSVIVEVTGTLDKVEALIDLLRPMGIKEIVRTGQVAMLRGDSPGMRHTPGANGHKKSQETVEK